MTTWFSVSTPEGEERLLGAWPGAPVENAEVIEMILDVAREQVIAYAPAELEIGSELFTDCSGCPVPARFVYAQLQQARNLWNAGQAGGDGQIGAEGFSFTPRPLDKTIRQIIRPTAGAASVF